MCGQHVWTIICGYRVELDGQCAISPMAQALLVYKTKLKADSFSIMPSTPLFFQFWLPVAMKAEKDIAKWFNSLEEVPTANAFDKEVEKCFKQYSSSRKATWNSKTARAENFRNMKLTRHRQKKTEQRDGLAEFVLIPKRTTLNIKNAESQNQMS